MWKPRELTSVYNSEADKFSEACANFTQSLNYSDSRSLAYGDLVIFFVSMNLKYGESRDSRDNTLRLLGSLQALRDQNIDLSTIARLREAAFDMCVAEKTQFNELKSSFNGILKEGKRLFPETSLSGRASTFRLLINNVPSLSPDVVSGEELATIAYGRQ